jgi:DNA replication and repair protein RecF
MIADINLQNFRSYKNDSFEFSDEVNIIVGPNASGKTNLIESILVLSKGKSYRAKDKELLKFGSDWLRLEALTEGDKKRVLKIRKDAQPLKSFEIESRQYTRLSPLTTLPLVLFEPNHLLMLSGGSERRRDYIDDLLEQTMPGYGSKRRQYKRVLAQRNALLKNSGNKHHDEIFPWNIRLSQLGGQIIKLRYNLLNKINVKIDSLYKELSKTTTNIKLLYETELTIENYETSLLKALEKNIELDKMRGFTTSGPHREDIKFLFNNRPSQEVASRGETRTLILGLKISELEFIEKTSKTKPILLLDDVFSELDGKRRHAVTDYLKKYQTFITTTDADAVIEHFTANANIIAL